MAVDILLGAMAIGEVNDVDGLSFLKIIIQYIAENLLLLGKSLVSRHQHGLHAFKLALTRMLHNLVKLIIEYSECRHLSVSNLEFITILNYTTNFAALEPSR